MWLGSNHAYHRLHQNPLRVKRAGGRRFRATLAHAPLLFFTLSMCFALVSSLAADTDYYRLTFDHTRPTALGFAENGKSYRSRRDGGGAAFTTGYDVLRKSRALVLRTAPTPPGADSDRAEIQIYSGITWNRDWVASLEFHVTHPSESVSPPSDNIADWQILMQCVQAGTSLPPPLSIDLEPEARISVVVRSEQDRHEILWSGPLPRDRWSEIAIGFRMGEKGRVRLWLDGKQLLDKRLPLGWHDGEERCVLKTGIYRAPASTPFELRLDDVTLADSYRATLSLP